MSVLSRRQAVIKPVTRHYRIGNDLLELIDHEIELLPSAEPERKTGEWIPFTSHEPDAEEKEMYPDYEYVLDGPLPEDGQRILVTIACAGYERVQEDEFYSDDGCYLDSGYDLISEAIAWMPLPEPYRKENG